MELRYVAWAPLLALLALVSSPVGATDGYKWPGTGLSAKPLSNLASYFVGADKLDGKYATAGILLGAGVLAGHYSGGDGSLYEKSSSLRDTVRSKLDDVFAPLLKVDPFKYSPLEVPKRVGSLFEDKIGTALTAGGDIVSSKLKLKLEGLEHGLGILRGTGDLIDAAVRRKEDVVRGAIDNVEHFIESDPQTAALKNLIFRMLIYHVYMDAGVNAQLTMLKHIKETLIGYKKLFGPFAIGIDKVANPVIGELDRSYGDISELLSLHSIVFDEQATDGDESPVVKFKPLKEAVKIFGEKLGKVITLYDDEDSQMAAAIRGWLDDLSTSEPVAALDGASVWSKKVSKSVDTQVHALEDELNHLVQGQNDLIIKFVKGHYLPDAAGVDYYLKDLVTKTAGAADVAVHKYLSLLHSFLGSFAGLFGEGKLKVDPYLGATHALADAGVDSVLKLWDIYFSALSRQAELATSLGLELPNFKDHLSVIFEKVLYLVGYVPDYFDLR